MRLKIDAVTYWSKYREERNRGEKKKWKERKTDRQTERLTDRQADRQTERNTERNQSARVEQFAA